VEAHAPAVVEPQRLPYNFDGGNNRFVPTWRELLGRTQSKEAELEGDNEVVQNPAHMVQETAPRANPNEAAETAIAPNLEDEVRAKATGVCIEGYLMRQSREGKWKKRFYETVEENGWWMLVFYKTPEREKVLNVVKLHRTSQIAISDKDEHGAGVFGIEMESSQVYLHKAASELDAEKWVAALVQCRAAAIQQVSGWSVPPPQRTPPPLSPPPPRVASTFGNLTPWSR